MRSRSPWLLIVVLLAGCVSGPASQTQATPRSDIILGAIGNSLMLGYNADRDHIESAPGISWATGNETWSFRSRVGAESTENVAILGASADRYVEQAGKLRTATLALVLLPDAALCASPRPGGGAAGSFESQLREGTRSLVARGIRPMLLTTPDIASVADAARGKPPANDFVLNYAGAQACATQPGFQERQTAMNAMIVRVASEEGALSDHGAVSRIRWTPDMVSDVDGFHPSPKGLQAIATAVWDAYEASSAR